MTHKSDEPLELQKKDGHRKENESSDSVNEHKSKLSDKEVSN